MNNNSTIFQSNSKSLLQGLGMQCFTPDRVSTKKINAFKQQYDSQVSLPKIQSNPIHSENNIFYRPKQQQVPQSFEQYQAQSQNNLPTINDYKLLNGYNSSKKSAFFKDQSNVTLQNNSAIINRDIIDWVSGNLSTKASQQSIVVPTVQIIKLSQFNAGNSSSQSVINFRQSNQEFAQNTTSDVNQISSTSSQSSNNPVERIRRIRRNIPKSMDESSMLSMQSQPALNMNGISQESSFLSSQITNSPQSLQISNPQNQNKRINILTSQQKQQQYQRPILLKESQTSLPQIQSLRASIDYEQCQSYNSPLTSLSKIDSDSSIKINQKLKESSMKSFTIDRNSTLYDLIPDTENIKSRTQIIRKKAHTVETSPKEKIVSNSKISMNFKSMTEGDQDDSTSTRPNSNSFENVSESLGSITSPSTSQTVLSKNGMKSILKQPKEKVQDFFGDLVDATKSPRNKKVSFQC